VPLKNSHCRLCWLQAASLSADPPVVTEDDLARVTCHQLWFAGMTKMRGPRSGVRLRANLRATAVVALRSPEPKPVDSGQLQLHLPGAGRAFHRARHAEPTSPALIRARRIAQALGEGRGWNTKLAAELDRALVILLSGHGDGEQFHYSDLIGVLHRYGVSINRVAEVLAEMGLLLDDRVPAFDTWLEDKLTDLAAGIAADVRDWAQVLRHGGPVANPATSTPSAATCAPRTPCWSNGPHDTTTCARPPPATSTRSPTPCAATCAGEPSARCAR
jgi:hypothetical protein